ncbi:hypothetical protein QQS21_008783 [Conoideocrella luteorostrata]|uniref:DUF7907 domain-containing protein n=1 Tax=Conoideocrella luteorostrata TaxID=1105319 RepID=A0AAJ0FR30_9HYPO|nr:hypothetical protein QQS21_008783 [Conoideocrella luteorostrata]
MLLSAVALSLISLAAAASHSSERRTAPQYPSLSITKGFRLVVNVTDPSKDFHPSIQNTYVSSIHVGPALALIGQVDSVKRARIFYQNGTTTDQKDGKSNILSDGGSPIFSSGLKLIQDSNSDNISNAYLNGGPGDAGIGITGSPHPYAFLQPEAWVACNTSVPYYRGRHFIILKRTKITAANKSGNVNETSSEGCAPVRLLPECAELNGLPGGSVSSHDYALDTPCYSDVKSLVWSRYGL